jgi:hypothetical protein
MTTAAWSSRAVAAYFRDCESFAANRGCISLQDASSCYLLRFEGIYYSCFLNFCASGESEDYERLLG